MQAFLINCKGLKKNAKYPLVFGDVVVFPRPPNREYRALSVDCTKVDQREYKSYGRDVAVGGGVKG